MKLIHADGCTTNLGVIGANCNCGAKAQLDSCEKEMKELFEKIEGISIADNHGNWIWMSHGKHSKRRC